MIAFIVIRSYVLQEVQCPEVNCAFGNATIPAGSCCPVCGETYKLQISVFVNIILFTIKVCENGDEAYLPGEAFMKDCNSWYKITITTSLIYSCHL